MTATSMECTLCPACLTDLPEDYPFDHVAVDRAVAGDRAVFVAMTADERREVVTTALTRGIDLLDLTHRLHWSIGALQDLLPAEHPESCQAQAARNEQLIRELWQQGLQDVTISARTGLNPSKVGRIRKRLGLTTLSRRRWEAMT